METVLLAGGAGYIGSHVAKYLKRSGHLPVAYDNLSRGHREAVKWGPLEQGSIGDKRAVLAVLEKYRPSTVIHFAAFAYVGESVAKPAEYYANNVSQTLVFLEALVEAGVKNVVFSSTCAIYGVPSRIPIVEEEPANPINPYGRGKLMVEHILSDFETAYGLKSVCLRYFNAAGADPEGETGEHHDPETHLIPIVLETALGKRPAVPVLGTDYPTPDGTCVRDYIHVMDLAQAHVQAMDHLLAGKPSLRLNLGNGNGYSVLEVIEKARAITGRPIAADLLPRRAGDPPALVGSAEKAREILGWKPQFGSLDSILGTAWEWHRKRG